MDRAGRTGPRSSPRVAARGRASSTSGVPRRRDRRAPGLPRSSRRGLAVLAGARGAGALRLEPAPARSIARRRPRRAPARMRRPGRRPRRRRCRTRASTWKVTSRWPPWISTPSSPSWTLAQRTILPPARGPSPGTLTRTFSWTSPLDGRSEDQVADRRVVAPGHPAFGIALGPERHERRLDDRDHLGPTESFIGARPRHSLNRMRPLQPIRGSRRIGTVPGREASTGTRAGQHDVRPLPPGDGPATVAACVCVAGSWAGASS